MRLLGLNGLSSNELGLRVNVLFSVTCSPTKRGFWKSMESGVTLLEVSLDMTERGGEPGVKWRLEAKGGFER